MNSKELDGLKVGDRVGMVRFGSWGMADHAFGTITKITPKTRRFTVAYEHRPEATKVFDKNGDEPGKRYHGMNLIAATDLQERLDAVQRRRDANKRADALLEEIKKHKTGMGDYQFDEEARGKLLALAAQL